MSINWYSLEEPQQWSSDNWYKRRTEKQSASLKQHTSSSTVFDLLTKEFPSLVCFPKQNSLTWSIYHIPKTGNWDPYKANRKEVIIPLLWVETCSRLLPFHKASGEWFLCLTTNIKKYKSSSFHSWEKGLGVDAFRSILLPDEKKDLKLLTLPTF